MDQQYLSVIDEKAELLEDVANYLWDHPETAFTEFQSAAYLCDALRKEGFTVKENLAGIQTAFSGTYGSGKPVIGILGEFDALSGLSQEAGCPEKKSIGGQNGHGCGHHLYAAGALCAAPGPQNDPLCSQGHGCQRCGAAALSGTFGPGTGGIPSAGRRGL